jgi:uncharacterized protein (TIGR03435 family)
MRVVAPVILAVVLAASLLAQSTGSSSFGPAFEVASVKPNVSGSFSSTTTGNATSFTAVNMTARALIAFAYRIRDFQLVAPDWTESERYDISARGPAGASGDNRLRMQALMAERFKLVVHRETRDQPVYALVLARRDGKLGPQMRPSTIDCKGAAAPDGRTPCGINTTVGGAAGKMTGVSQTTENVADALGNFGLSRMVIDRTGLPGSFDFELTWTPDTARPSSGGVPPETPSLFTAIQEQLGLKLDPQRGPVEFLIVDSVERPSPD